MALKVGIQMYSVRGEMEKDPIATSRTVADIGYKYLEYANLNAMEDYGCGFGADAEPLREVVSEAGATVIATHAWPLDETNINNVVAYHKDLGTQFIVSKFLYRNLDELIDLAKLFNVLGEKCQEAGIEHLVHTSLMRSTGDRTDLDELLDRVDHDLVGIELDTYWALRSGIDPVWALKKYGKHIRVLHQKDMPAKIEQPVNIVDAVDEDFPLDIGIYRDLRYVAPDNFTEIGTGVFALQDIIDAANQHTNAEYILLEQDYTTLPELESVTVSIDNFRKRTGIEPT